MKRRREVLVADMFCIPLKCRSLGAEVESTTPGLRLAESSYGYATLDTMSGIEDKKNDNIA